MRIDTCIILINILLALSVFLQAVTIYKTPHCTIDDIHAALEGMEFDVVEY